MAIPSWLSVAFTIADFVVQRVDRVGPVSFEPPEKQPPEAAAETVDAPEMDASLDEAPPAEVDSPQSSQSSDSFGFQAARNGGGGTPSGGGGGSGGNGDNGDNGDDNGNGGDNGNGDEPLDRSGGGCDPSSGGDPGNEDDDNGSGEGAVQCSFRAMRPEDAPTRYEVEKARDNAGEERPA